MLIQRILKTSTGWRSGFSATIQRRLASQQSNPAASAFAERVSVYSVNGVPIVSNWEVPIGTAHPDPGMTGGYVNPPAEKRQFRDAREDYWDKQDRRNYGEPVNEDEDILGRFTPEVYTWTSPKMGLIQNGLFWASILGLTGICYMFYPDKPAAPRTFPHDGLEKALGGPKALPAASDKK